MTFTRASLVPLFVTAALPLALACSSGEETPGGGAGTGGTGASGGTAGVGGSGGTAGSAAGTGGAGGTAGSAAGTGGSAGVGGTAGSGGSAGGGAGGTAGAAAGMSGAAGSGGGMSGAAGESGGMSGAAGAAGAAGESGGMSGAAGSSGAGGAAGAAGNGGSGGSGGGGSFTLTLEGFTPMAGCDDDMRDNCTVWPRDLQQFMNGPNMSPAMTWANPPAGTMSFAVSLEDLTNGNDHWVLWNLPGSTMMLAEDVPDSMMNQASIGSGNGYFGPGSSCNVYEFTVFALSMAMFSPNNATDPEEVFTQLNALGNVILGKATVRGRQDFSGNCNP